MPRRWNDSNLRLLLRKPPGGSSSSAQISFGVGANVAVTASFSGIQTAAYAQGKQARTAE
jgi:hypothetical protein